MEQHGPSDVFPTKSESLLSYLTTMDNDQAEEIALPMFWASILPYLAFLYFLNNVKKNECPKGVIVGFTAYLVLLLFVGIPIAIVSVVVYGVPADDSDWLHGCGESFSSITYLAIVISFRQALNAKERGEQMPKSATRYAPTIWPIASVTVAALATGLIQYRLGAEVHTPFMNGMLDLPNGMEGLGARAEHANAMSIVGWILHNVFLVEGLMIMGFAWRWADVVGNPKWKGLTWGFLPLHVAAIFGNTYHFFYNQNPVLYPLGTMLMLIGHTTVAYAAFRIAVSSGWVPPIKSLAASPTAKTMEVVNTTLSPVAPVFIMGFDLGPALSRGSDYSIVFKLYGGCALASYLIKYGETFFRFPYDANMPIAILAAAIPSVINGFMWYKRSKDPTFHGWFQLEKN